MDTAPDRGPGAARASFSPGPGAKSARAASEGDPHETSLLEPLERTFASVKRMAADYALLAVLDMRRAAIQLAWLVGAGILIAVLVVTAWLAAVVAGAVWLLGQGMSWPAVLGVAALVNLVGAGLVVWRVKDVFEHAPLSATLKQIRGDETKDGRIKT